MIYWSKTEMPTVLLQVCANVLAFEAVLKRWEQNDHTRKWSFIRFPGTELQQYADTSFATLKSDQVALLGKLQLSRWSRRR